MLALFCVSGSVLSAVPHWRHFVNRTSSINVFFCLLQEESYHMIADTVEMDELNSHECMAKIRALLKHLLENKISPVPTMVRNVYRFQNKGFYQVNFSVVFVRTMISGLIDIIISLYINCSDYREQLLLRCQVGCLPYTRSSFLQIPIWTSAFLLPNWL